MCKALAIKVYAVTNAKGKHLCVANSALESIGQQI